MANETSNSADEGASKRKPLASLKVIDAATIFAGPLVATLLGDFGADVVKIEHPQGDALREMGLKKDGHGLWWKVANRNKRCITLNLKAATGSKVFKRLIADADVLVENFRTGTLESWGLGPDDLHAINPRLVIVRMTGFGQTGPYKRRPGFGTLAEAMSGFAHLMGEADGPPQLPPFGLADGIAAHYGTFATMFALYDRDARGHGKGQVVDVAIYEPIFALLGAQPTWFDQLGYIQTRQGNRSVHNAPRNAYKTKDGRWVALSAAAASITKRVLTLCGGEAFASDPRFATNMGRVEHVEEIDAAVGGWIGRHTLTEVIAEFEKVEAAIAPIYDVGQIFEDPQFQARPSIIDVPDFDLGRIKMQNVFPFLSDTPGEIQWAGVGKGHHNREVFLERLKLDADTLAGLKAEGCWEG